MKTIQRALLVLTSTLTLASCATAGLPGACQFSVASNPPDAMVYVDDVLLGRASEWTGPGHFIKPGFHRVELRHPDYYSSFSEVDCPGGTTSEVKAQLHKLVE